MGTLLLLDIPKVPSDSTIQELLKSVFGMLGMKNLTRLDSDHMWEAFEKSVIVSWFDHDKWHQAMCYLKFIPVIIYLVEAFVSPLDGNNEFIDVKNILDDKGTGNVLGIEFHNGAMENNKSLHSYGLYQTTNSMWQLSVLYRLWKGLVENESF